jgi:hypothetical protein
MRRRIYDRAERESAGPAAGVMTKEPRATSGCKASRRGELNLCVARYKCTVSYRDVFGQAAKKLETARRSGACRGAESQNPCRTIRVSWRKRSARSFIFPTVKAHLAQLQSARIRVASGRELVRDGQTGEIVHILHVGWACCFKLLPDGGDRRRRDASDGRRAPGKRGRRSAVERTAHFFLEGLSALSGHRYCRHAFCG